MQIELTHDFTVPPERVFAVLDDHANMGRWLGVPISVVKQVDGGVGTVRRIQAGFFHVDEEIIERDAPRHLAYRIIGAPPALLKHRGDVSVERRGDKTRLRWTVEVHSPVPLFAQTFLSVVRVGIKRGLQKLDRQLSTLG